jgi:hypothetical protein
MEMVVPLKVLVSRMSAPVEVVHVDLPDDLASDEGQVVALHLVRVP